MRRAGLITHRNTPASNYPESQSQRGFTLIELVAVIVIASILAILAAPSLLGLNTFDSGGFYDQMLVTLRYAQKTAIAQNRHVCVALTANDKVTLTTGTDSACTTNPGGSTNLAPTPPCSQTTYAVCSSNATFSSPLSSFSFDAQGGPSFASTQKISISGAGSICIAAETGYVYSVATGQSC
jgi:MSHA pilin protein MshC